MESKTITIRTSFTLISSSFILKRFELEALIANLLDESLEIMHNRCKFHRLKIFAIEGWNSILIVSDSLFLWLSTGLNWTRVANVLEKNILSQLVICSLKFVLKWNTQLLSWVCQDSGTALTRFTCLTNFDTIFPAPREFMLLVLQLFLQCSLCYVFFIHRRAPFYWNSKSFSFSQHSHTNFPTMERKPDCFCSRNRFTCLIFQGNEILSSLLFHLF